MTSAHLTRRIAQASGIVMASVLASRVLGFFRDWTVAHQIGSNAITDAYYAAFTLPDFLNYLVAGGFAEHHLYSRFHQVRRGEPRG